MKIKFLPFLVLIVFWIIFSIPFFFQGKTPFPSDYQNNFFAPWNVYPGHQGPVKNNAQPDIITQIYPWRYFDIQQYKKGQIPFWNPYSFAGTPHLANYQSAALFPLNLLFFLPFKFIDVWSFLVLLQPLLAGIFMYIFARRLKLTPPSSLLSAFSFMFCGFLTTWMGYATLGYSILFLPLSLYSVRNYVESNNLKWLLLLSLTFLFSFFAGHFQTSLYFTSGVLSFIGYNILFSEKKKLYFHSLLFSFFGLLLAMPQILPSMEFYSFTVRSNLFQKVEAIPWNYLPTIISPDFYGNPVTRNDWFGHYAEWSSFAGVIPFVFALFAILFKRNKETWLFVIIFFVALLLAFDSPLLSLLVTLKVPVLSTSAASRIIVLLSFSLAILAGFGFDEILILYKKAKRKIIIWLVISLIPALIIVIFPYATNLSSDKIHLAQKNMLLTFLLIAITLISTVFLLILKNKYSKQVFILVILISCSFEMYRFASKWQSFSPRESAYIPVQIAKFYANLNDYDRAIGLSGEEDSIYFNIPTLGGYDPLYINEYGKFVQYVGSGEYRQPERSVVTFPINGKYTHEAIDLLGVKYVIHKKSDGELAWAFPFKKYPIDKFKKVYDDNFYDVFQNIEPFPRVFVVSKVIQGHQNNLFDYDLRNIALIDQQIANLDPNSNSSAKIIAYTPNTIEIEATSSAQSLLILTDIYYPGWHASVNNVSTKIIKTDYTFRGVLIPKGKSKIIFTYTPQSFLIGTYLFLTGIMGMIVFIFIKKTTKLS